MTAAAYDPDLIDRLVREAREDDATMSDERIEHLSGVVSDIRNKAMERAWSEESHRKRELYLMASLPSTLDAMDELLVIARTRNNLRAMADQLEALRRELAERDRRVASLLHLAEDLERQRHDTALREIHLAALAEAAQTWRAAKYPQRRSWGVPDTHDMHLVSAVDTYKPPAG